MRKKIILMTVVSLIVLTVLVLYFSTAAAFNSGYDNNGYISVVVQPGDTLWTIANKNNKSEKDIRLLIREIEVKNNLRSSVINPGQTIKVPLS